MEKKLCKTIYFVKLTTEDKIGEDLKKYLKQSKINLIIGNDPLSYIQKLKSSKIDQQVIKESSPELKNNEENKLVKSESNKNLKLLNSINETSFVFEDFNSDIFLKVQKETKQILGITSLKYCLRQKIPIVINTRPTHNFCMENLYICFGKIIGIDKARVNKYLNLIRYMGGSGRGELDTNRTTHLISNYSSGKRYTTARTCGIPVMNFSWIDYSWEHRFDENFKANDHQVIESFKLPPFTLLYLSFVNFNESDLNEMKELTLKNGGEVVNWDDKKCTHIIIDSIPGDCVELSIDNSVINKNVHLVYKEWFWASLEITARADEKIINHAYPLSYTKTNKNHSVCTLSDSRNLSFEILSPTLDFSTDSIIDSGFNESKIENKNDFQKLSETINYQNFSKRRKICIELLQTEKSYIEILRTIINVFYEPLKPTKPNELFKLPELNEQSKSPKSTEQTKIQKLNELPKSIKEPASNKPLLDDTERNFIFGGLPPILEIHEKIYNDLEKTIENWDENCSIGNVFIKYYSALLKAYPSFINFFENIKETLVKCDEKYPRFHAFLKKCQSRPECKRQSLTELLIRPVQRLPSIILLLSDILKNTGKGLVDHKQLKLAIDKIKEVLTHINEDKRKTEGQIAMFDIINDIEECPASLLSANRHFLCKSDAKLILKNENKALPLKSSILTLFLFNDVLEICKKRSIKRSDSLNQKNGKTSSIISSGGSKQSVKKSYKHIDTLPLEVIKLIYHFALHEDHQNAITIVTNPMLFGTSRTYRTYPFVLEDKEVKPEVFLTKFSQQIFNPNIIIKGALNEILDIDFEYADQLADKLHKSNFGFARTKEKITRAFSMKKQSSTNIMIPNSSLSTSLYTPPRPIKINVSPSPRRLSRAFSSFMNIGSPLNISRRQMSTTSLNEINDNLDGTFSCPTTPAPRKKKCIVAN